MIYNLIRSILPCILKSSHNGDVVLNVCYKSDDNQYISNDVKER